MAAYSTDFLSGGTPSADSVYQNGASYTADKACDNNTGTVWITKDGVSMPHWWKYDLGVGNHKRAKKCTLKSDIVEGSDIGIKNFNIQGSSNDSDWTTLHSDTMANNTDVQTFLFNNGNKYRYYKINIIDNHSASYPNFAKIAEIELMQDIPTGFFIFLCEAFKNHDKIWKPNLLLPKDLGFSY